MNRDHSTAVGTIHGRFQPFHKGHLSYAELALKQCDFLVVGITNPDPRHLRELPGDDARHLPGSNPFTFYERYLMIQGCLLELGLSSSEFAIVPFAIDLPEIWPHYFPCDAIHFLRDRGEWTKTKIQKFSSQGYSTQIIEDSRDLEITATEVRRRLAEKTDWRNLVPSATAALLETIDAEGRVGSTVG